MSRPVLMTHLAPCALQFSNELLQTLAEWAGFQIRRKVPSKSVEISLIGKFILVSVRIAC